MASALAHRGPDDSGIFQESASGIGFAFRRLAILDLSTAGHQPMFSASGRYVMIFNGEVYNFDEVRAELGAHVWRGHSDSEVMLEAFERWGLEPAVQRFVGMFAFALWDRSELRLHLVRDRMGIKPLYFGRVAGDFVFGSELKAIQRHPGFVPAIDRDVLGLYMRHNYVPSPHCIYKGLYKLRPGHVLTLDSATGEPELHSFWSATDFAREGTQSRFAGSEAEAIEQLHQKLLEAVRLRMIADVPLGGFLSGGIDSSTVVALMQAQSKRPVKTFTIGFHENQYNEAAHAKQVAGHLGTEHTELYLTPKDALHVVPLLPAMYDEPFSDTSEIPTYLVSKLARSSVTVSLSGDGGDELFGGYRRYLFARSMWGLSRRLPVLARRTLAKLLCTLPAHAIDRGFQAIWAVIPKGARIPSVGDKTHKLAGYLQEEGREQIYLRTLSHWQDPSHVVVDCHEPTDVLQSISESASLPSYEEAMMLTDQLNYLPDDILTKVDRASMAVSLEARVPILDHRVAEFAWRLPLSFKIRNGTTKWILRQLLYKYVPKELVERPKMGFAVPIGSWLRGPLREWAEDLLSESTLRQDGLLHAQPIRKKWEEHLSGARNWERLLWDVLIFQDWSANVFRNSKVAPVSS